MSVDVFLYEVPGVFSRTDVVLRDPTVGAARRGGRPPERPPIKVASSICPNHPPGMCRRVEGRFGWYCLPAKIEARSLWKDVSERYGKVEGTQVYIGLKRLRKGPFGKGRKYDPTRKPPPASRAANQGRRHDR